MLGLLTTRQYMTPATYIGPEDHLHFTNGRAAGFREVHVERAR